MTEIIGTGLGILVAAGMASASMFLGLLMDGRRLRQRKREYENAIRAKATELERAAEGPWPPGSVG